VRFGRDLVSAAVCLSLWSWRPAAMHLFLLALLAIILADVALWGFRKIPFTCSYLPGKSLGSRQKKRRALSTQSE
jgi:hypothetical protein